MKAFVLVGFAVAICFCATVLSGCSVVSTQEPMGVRLLAFGEGKTESEKVYKGVLERVWTSNGKDVIRFERGQFGCFVAKNESSEKGLQQYMGFARAWEDRLLFHVVWLDERTQRPVLVLMMVKVEQDSKLGWVARVYAPKLEAFKEERIGSDGSHIKLDASVAYSAVSIKSDEKTLNSYLAACKPDDLFKPVESAPVMKGYTSDEWSRFKAEQAATQPGK